MGTEFPDVQCMPRLRWALGERVTALILKIKPNPPFKWDSTRGCRGPGQLAVRERVVPEGHYAGLGFRVSGLWGLGFRVYGV